MLTARIDLQTRAVENEASETFRTFLARLSARGADKGDQTHFLALAGDSTSDHSEAQTSSVWSPSLRTVTLISGLGVLLPPFGYLLGHGSAWHMILTKLGSPEDVWLSDLHQRAELREFAEALIPTVETGGAFISGASLHLHALDDEDRLFVVSNASLDAY